jgi:hypothetical protein
MLETLGIFSNVQPHLQPHPLAASCLREYLARYFARIVRQGLALNLLDIQA